MFIQTLLIVITSLVYLLINKDLSLFTHCLYGGLISIINALLIKRISHKQQKIKIHNASVGLRIMVVSVITRLTLIALLVLIGLRLDFEPFAILLGFSIGQVGLVIDTLRNK
jgi:multisubunit Na+/H+ antiporter MnhE subunit